MKNKEYIKWVFSLFNAYKFKLTMIVSILVFSSILSLLIPSINQKIMDDGFLNINTSNIIKYSVFLLIIILIQAVVSILKEWIRVNLHADMKYKLFDLAFNKLLKMKLDFFKENTSTEILNNIKYDLDNIVRVTDQDFFSPLTQIFNMIGAVLGLFFINIKLTLLLLLFIPLKFIIINIFSNLREKLTVNCIEANKEFSKWFGDTIDGIKEVKVFNIYEYKASQFSDKAEKVISLNKKFSLLDSYNILFDTTFIQLITVMLYIIASNYFFHLDMSIGSLYAFITYSPYIIQPMYSILNVKYMLASIIPSAKHFCEFLNLRSEISTENLQNEMTYVKGKIHFKDVSFSYDEEKVLDKVNFTVDSGEKIALMGANGTGKSTILNLILRIYNPSFGAIYLDDIDINTININSYRDCISIINQDIYLFNDTLRKNITLHNCVSEEKLMDVIKLSRLERFVEENGLDYEIAANGENLSGGQKQKIAIARALIRDTKIFLLDEVVANLDMPSAKEIYELINTTLKDKTIIVIAHDAKIYNYVDKIIFLKKRKAYEKIMRYERR